MIRATLDTNVLVSGLAGLDLPASTPGAIVRRWIGGAFELVVSEAIITEFRRTLTKPYYRSRRSLEQISATEQMVVSMATIVVPTAAIRGVASHPEDDLVLDTAVSANVDYLVTGDKQLQNVGQVEGILIIAPRAFLNILELKSDAVNG